MPELTDARPTITIDNQDNPSLAQGLTNLMIVENTSGLYRCEATFGNLGTVDSNPDFLYFDRRTLDFGKTFKVKLGTDLLFEGRIMALEGRFPEGQAAEITVMAEDRFQDLRMTRRTRTFFDVSDSGVFGQIANDHGLSLSASLNGPTYKVLAQVNQSDLAFLRERARAIDAETWMDGSTLNAKPHSQRNGGTLTITYNNELHEVFVSADLASQRSSVAVSGWDVAGKKALQHEATDSIINSELNGRVSGASILNQALGQRKEALVHTIPLNAQEARNAAESFFKMSARRFVTAHGTAQANAKMRVGSYIEMKGLGPLFSGKYYLTDVRHTFDGEKGLKTEFTAETPGLGRP